MFKHFTQALIALGPAGMLALAFLDSTGLPVSAGMDALMIFLAVQAPRTAWISAAAAVVGSTAGNLVLFTAARKGGKRFLEHAAKPGRAQRFRDWFERYGLVTVFVPAFVPFPLPLKLFVISAGVMGTRRSTFLAVVVLARVLRYGSEIWLGVALGRSSEGFLKSHVWHFAAGGLLLFLALYLLVWFNDSARRRKARGVD
jgi:membrane protein YqaA with SNARE-associated domain